MIFLWMTEQSTYGRNKSFLQNRALFIPFSRTYHTSLIPGLPYLLGTDLHWHMFGIELATRTSYDRTAGVLHGRNNSRIAMAQPTTSLSRIKNEIISSIEQFT